MRSCSLLNRSKKKKSNKTLKETFSFQEQNLVKQPFEYIKKISYLTSDSSRMKAEGRQALHSNFTYCPKYWKLKFPNKKSISKKIKQTQKHSNQIKKNNIIYSRHLVWGSSCINTFYCIVWTRLNPETAKGFNSLIRLSFF